jgi:hypothetical protein
MSPLSYWLLFVASMRFFSTFTGYQGPKIFREKVFAAKPGEGSNNDARSGICHIVMHPLWRSKPSCGSSHGRMDSSHWCLLCDIGVATGELEYLLLLMRS